MDFKLPQTHHVNLVWFGPTMYDVWTAEAAINNNIGAWELGICQVEGTRLPVQAAGNGFLPR